MKTLLISRPSDFAAKLLDLRLSRELHNGSNLSKIDLSKNLTTDGMVDEFISYRFDNSIKGENNNTANFIHKILYHTCERIGDFVSPRNARHILLASTFRSGSTFLGELLSRYPGTFYSFEPLIYTRTMNTSEVPWSPRLMFSRKTKDMFVQQLLKVFKCRPDIEYIRYISYIYPSIRHNFRLWDTCKTLCPGCSDELVIRKCSFLSFYNLTCPKFPIRLMKTVRFRMEDSEKLLLDPDIGKSLKIIFLVRNPRDVIKSRSLQSKWCNFAECSSPDILCKNLQDDVSAAFRLRVRYPGE